MNARPQWVLPAAWMPATWLQPAVAPYRACERCTAVLRKDGELRCADAMVAHPHGSVPVSVARARDGVCGPNASHQRDEAMPCR